MHKEHLTVNAQHRFTVALPMQIRYAALGALTNRVGGVIFAKKLEVTSEESPKPSGIGYLSS